VVMDPDGSVYLFQSRLPGFLFFYMGSIDFVKEFQSRLPGFLFFYNRYTCQCFDYQHVSIPFARVGTIENHSPFFEIRIPFNESQDQKNGLGLNLISRFSGYIARYPAVHSRNIILAVSI